MNRVVLVGRLTKDPELKYTNTNIPVVQFTLAVNRRFASANGERQADFINCVVWRQPAETLSKYTKKGNLLGVEGSIQTRTYDDPSGQRKYITEVVCDSFTFLESKGSQSNQNSRENDVNQYNIPSSNQYSSYNQNNNKPKPNFQEKDPFEELQSDYNFSDDDLPF